MNHDFRRPTLLSIGIVLTATYSAVVLLLAAIGGLIGVGVGGFAVVGATADQLLPVGLAASAVALVLLGILLVHGVTLVACLRAWHGSRRWTIALIGLASLGLVSAGPLGIAFHVLTIIGCVQSLEHGGGRSSVSAR